MVMTTCPLCGSKRLRRSLEVYVTRRGGKKVTINDLEVYRCDRCKQGFLSDEAMRRIEERARRRDAA